jgi:hypothetical protein
VRALHSNSQEASSLPLPAAEPARRFDRYSTPGSNCIRTNTCRETLLYSLFTRHQKFLAISTPRTSLLLLIFYEKCRFARPLEALVSIQNTRQTQTLFEFIRCKLVLGTQGCKEELVGNMVSAITEVKVTFANLIIV